MALLWIEGFESLGDTIGSAPAPTDVMAGKYDTVVSESYFDIETGRLSGKSIQTGIASQRFHKVFSTTDRTLIVGFAVKFREATTGSNTYLSNMFSNGTWSIGLYYTGFGSFKIINGGSVTLGEFIADISGDKWHYIEWKVYCDNTAGTVTVKVDGKEVYSLTGVDTQYTSYNYHNEVNFKDNNSLYFYIDDWYVCDSSGSDNNDFLGNVRVKTIRPDGDDSVQWTPTTAGSNYDEVDESEHDSGTTNVATSTANDEDLYTYGSLDLDSIDGLLVGTVAALDAAGSETMQTVVKSGTTEDTSSNHTIDSTDYETKTYVSEQDPDASAAWTSSTVNAASFGIKYI